LILWNFVMIKILFYILLYLVEMYR
jgi:hypothetical protein